MHSPQKYYEKYYLYFRNLSEHIISNLKQLNLPKSVDTIFAEKKLLFVNYKKKFM